jgi:hypothetical protein
MCKNNRVIWILVTFVAAVYLIADWYDDNYCDDTAIPVLCRATNA